MSNVEPLGTARVRRRLKRATGGGGGWTLNELGRRMIDVEDDLDGVTDAVDKLTKRITGIGLLLSGAFIGSGILDGKAVEVIRAILFGGG